MIIIYSKVHTGYYEELLCSAKNMVPTENLKVCTSIHELSGEICRPGIRNAIVILLASDQNDYDNILSLRDLLWGVRIILIMHSSNPDIILQGHLLNPRFLSACDSSYREAVSVLQRMINKASTGNPIRKRSPVKKSSMEI